MATETAQHRGLEVHNLRVEYGGAVAVDNACLDAPQGTITGLIGPNGAGKTSLFNAVNGLVRPAGGSVSLFGRNLTRKAPHVRAQWGLGRTFQLPQIFANLTVRENIGLGPECRFNGANPLRQIWATRARRRQTTRATEEAMDLCGIGDVAETQGAALTLGQRRLVELARVCAGEFGFVLLDEPSSGLDDAETRAFARIVQQIAADRSVGVLLVEHDVALVMELCSSIYVLDYGRLIFQGTPTETRDSSVVRSAYLGEVNADLPAPPESTRIDVSR